MKLLAFRVRDFRSIADTGWCELSPDGITVLVGQNESGKTSVLHGILLFQADAINADDLRGNDVFPSVSLRFACEASELRDAISSLPEAAALGPLDRVKDSVICIERRWTSMTDSTLSCDAVLPPASAPGDEENPSPEIENAALASALHRLAPQLILFDRESGLIPDDVRLDALINDIEGTPGLNAAKNIIKVAELDLQALLLSDPRLADNAVTAANRQLNSKLDDYWRQRIGERIKVRLEAQLTRDSVGASHLNFWVVDGQHKLYPHQRSQGLRWFLSFFLQMLAGRGYDIVYLVDEPGAQLHAKAQEDVLRVFEDLRDQFPIIYTTHSPYLIDMRRVGRLMVLERADADDDKCPTVIIGAHALGAASRDSLSPLYTAMGIDFSHQNVIEREGNLILEEISAYYYLQAFFRLFEPDHEVPHMLPATGADNVPVFANLLLGWGLQFAILLDDDAEGRGVAKLLETQTFAGRKSEVSRRVIRTPGPCIEAVFTKTDYRRYVLQDVDVVVDEVCGHTRSRSKGADALGFFDRVCTGQIQADSFQQTTRANVAKLLERVLRAVWPT